MKTTVSARRLDASDEGGFMLIELLVVFVLMGIVGGLISDAIISSFKGQRDITARAADLDGLRQAMERTTRDMRSASQVGCATTSLLTLQVPLQAGGSQTLMWSVSGTTLSETTLAAGADPCVVPTTLGTTVISNVDPATTVFSYLNKAGYTPVDATAQNRTTCMETAHPTVAEPRCVGAVTIALNALLPGHPDLTLTEPVQLRNVT